MTPKKKRPDNIYAPYYWPTWCGLGIMWVSSLLPYSVTARSGRFLGWILFKLHRSRRRIAYINIRTCFTDKTDQECLTLTSEHFSQVGQSFMTTGFNWYASRKRILAVFKIKGIHHLNKQLANGKNIILLAPHFVALEIGGIMLANDYPSVSMYQFVKNARMDRAIKNGRCRFGMELVERRAPLRQLIKAIRSGKAFYYLPDQDPGPRAGIFVPFFNIQTYTYPMLSRFAQLGKAVVLPCVTKQLDGCKGYEMTIREPLVNFPSSDETVDTTVMNQAIEKEIVDMPSQYLWIHKRFKTRPEGSPDFYSS